MLFQLSHNLKTTERKSTPQPFNLSEWEDIRKTEKQPQGSDSRFDEQIINRNRSMAHELELDFRTSRNPQIGIHRLAALIRDEKKRTQVYHSPCICSEPSKYIAFRKQSLWWEQDCNITQFSHTAMSEEALPEPLDAPRQFKNLMMRGTVSWKSRVIDYLASLQLN